MVKVTVNRNDFQSFLMSFAKDLDDLRIACSGAFLTVEVAYANHYLRKRFPVETGAIEEEGFIHIALMDKFLKFIKASKQTNITLRQTAPVKPLHIDAGGNRLQIPSTDEIESFAKVNAMGRVISACIDNNFTVFYKSPLSAHGSISDTKDLISLAGMRKVIADNAQFKVRTHCGENEFGIVAGKAASGRLFTTLPITDTDGPSATIQSNFGEWLPVCLMYLDEGTARFHMGDGTPLIFEQTNTLLVVIDEGDE